MIKLRLATTISMNSISVVHYKMTALPVQALLLFSFVVVVYSKGHEREVVPNATCSVCCLQCPPGVPGVNGLNGRDGRDGAVGPPGPASFDLGELRQIIRLISKEEVKGVLSGINAAGGISPSPSMSTCEQFGTPQPVTITTTITKTVHTPSKAISSSLLSPSPPPAPSQPPSSSPHTKPTVCTLGQSEDNPAPSCAHILDCNPSAPSQNYWIYTCEGDDVSRLMYCHMGRDKCGVRGVMRVVNINMTNPEETCPSPLTLYTANEKRLCGSTNPSGQTCSSVTFPTFNYQYSYVCGRAVGFSYHHPCAFYYTKHGRSLSRTLDGAYVSGLSITHGAPGSRTHIWTYAGGYREATSADCNCPCAKSPGAPPPTFVGVNHYCESATQYSPPDYRWYTNNTLWDNEDCYPGSNCCNTPRAPWFVRALNTPTSDDVEIRWCTGQGLHRDRVGTEQVEIYVY